MKLAWATDIHLDCVNDASEKLKLLATKSDNCDSYIISGDITISPLLIQHLQLIESILQKPFYFVLGNHDYYFSDIISTRRRVAQTCNSMSFARYLATVPYIRLKRDVALVGHDGWYDALNGNYNNNEILMNDWIRISDFSVAMRSTSNTQLINKDIIVKIARAICQASVNHIASGIKSAIRDKNSCIIVTTHVPPFKESYNSEKYSSVNFSSVLPWYTSKTMGDMLMQAAKTYPHVKFIVLSGHAHSHYNEDLLNNLNVRVGKSAYGSPQIAGFVDI
jgi:predicted phosphohydrolase